MIQYTHNNHFKFGYAPNRFYQKRASAQDQFIFEYGVASGCTTDWRISNKQAAETIRANFKGDLWILFSGGTDSECCIHSFLDAEIPFKIATLRMKRNLNDHDLKYAVHFAKSHSLAIEYFDLDVEEFTQGDQLYRYTDPISCVSPILACHLWLADQVKGVPILAQGECHLKKEVPNGYKPGESLYEPSNWCLYESERACSLYMHFIKGQKPAVPGFFQYTPDQIYTFLTQNPLLKKLTNNELMGKLGTRSSKNQLIRQFYPEIELREKFTGFEKINELHDQIREKLAERYPDADSYSKENFHSLIKKMQPIRDIE